MEHKVIEDQPQQTEAFDHRSAIKLANELGPLVAFLVTWFALGIYWATGVLMVATLISLVVAYAVFKKVSPAPVATAVILCVFGGLTLLFHDPRYLYAKPTIINLLFAAVLAGGLATGRPLIRTLLGDQLQLTDTGWRLLTIRWMMFFLAMAAMNEIVIYVNNLRDPSIAAMDETVRKVAERPWVYFKLALLPLTIVFAAAQIGLLKRHQPSN